MSACAAVTSVPSAHVMKRPVTGRLQNNAVIEAACRNGGWTAASGLPILSVGVVGCSDLVGRQRETRLPPGPMGDNHAATQQTSTSFVALRSESREIPGWPFGASCCGE